MDNMRVHKNKEVIELMDKLRITPIFSPPYSPDYNPIEFVFSKLKRIAKKKRMQNMVSNKMVDYR